MSDLRKSPAVSMQGFTIIEVVFAVLFLLIVIVGLSHLLVSGMEQESFDTRDLLAMIAVNNMWERTLTMARDNYGPDSEGDRSDIDLSSGPSKPGDYTTPGDYTYTNNGNENNNPYPPAAPDLFTKCPNCIYDISLRCEKDQNTWNGYVTIINGPGGELLASIPMLIYQPGE
jgi:hypothetical protein